MTDNLAIWKSLADPFPAVHWRAQAVSGDGKSALALTYIDARDVMARLDAVVGPANWQDSYAETPKGRLICTLSIRVGDEWIAKSDGAGDTDVEGDKGAISDALKRAAVKWGVGRYLYDMPDTWAECESYESGGKKKWRKWTPAGLRKLQNVAPSAPVAEPELEPRSGYITDDQRDLIMALAPAAEVSIQTICEGYNISDLRELPASKYPALIKRLEGRPDETRKAA